MFRNLTGVFTLAFLAISATSFAQPQLPDMVGASDKGINVLSWTCQYDGISSIAVQRSSDSVFNFVTIGYVKNTAKGPQAYIDGHPAAGDNWYRLYIGFSSDLTWYSNRIKITIDSATLLEKGVIPPNDSLQQYAKSVKIDSEDVIAKTNTTSRYTTRVDNTRRNTTVNTTATPSAKPNLSLDIPSSQDANQLSYIKSEYVFTNPFTGHVTVELPKDTRYTYALRFYKKGQENDPILDIPRIKKKSVVIDKRNFGDKGIYKFILLENQTKIDEGYITIF